MLDDSLISTADTDHLWRSASLIHATLYNLWILRTTPEQKKVKFDLIQTELKKRGHSFGSSGNTG